MTNRRSVDAALLEAAARLANLPMPAGRAAELVPAMDGVFAMLDSLDQGSLGETPPSAAYNAAWEK
jgi:hypothetical protein